MGGFAIAMLGDPVRASGPTVGIFATVIAAWLGKKSRWLDAVAVLVSAALAAAAVETIYFGIGSSSLWVPLILLGVVIPLYGTRAAMLLVGCVAGLASFALGAEAAGWVTAEPLNSFQQALVVLLFTLAAAVLLADPMLLLSQTLTDSEERRRQVESAELRFHAIFDQSSSRFALLSSSGILQDLNASARAGFGPTSAEAIGAPLSQASWWTSEQAAQLEAALDAAAEGTLSRFELIADEETQPTVFSVQVAPFRDTSGVVQTIVVELMDVTDLVEVRQLLDHKRRLEALGQLAGGVAHDFNNMLGAVMVSAQLLADDPVVAEDPKREELSRIILDASMNGAQLTRKLLAFGRLDPIGRTTVDMQQLLVSTGGMLQRTLGPNIEVVLALSEEACNLTGDASALQAMIINLAVNARDAMPNGGQLVLRTQVIDLDSTWAATLPNPVQLGSTLLLNVEDNGAGMTPDVVSRIFEPFFTTKGVGKGTGLGLSAAHGTVLAHGGAVRVETEPGVGTAFQIFLPLDEATPSGEPKHAPEPGLALSGHVLVVDDELVMRQAVAAQLRAHGMTVQTASSVDQALDLLSQAPFDLLITDVVMPGRDGFELAGLVRAETPELPIVIMSGFTRQDPSIPPEVAALPVLSKPFVWAELVEAIQSARARKRS